MALGLGLSFALDRAFGLAVASGFTIDLLIYTAWLSGARLSPSSLGVYREGWLVVMSLGLFTLSAWQLSGPSERGNWVLFQVASL